MYDFARDHDLSVSDLGFQLLIPHIGSITIRAAPRLHRDDRNNHRPGCFQCPSFAYLRYRLRPLRFAFLKLLNIALTIIFNLFFLVVCPVIYKNHPDLISWFYRPDYGAGYILVSNVIASFVLLLLLTPEIFRIRWHFDWRLLKEILHYSFPLLILGLAGIMNQNLDKILYPYLLSDPQVAADQLGIYGANVKIAVVMIMFTQAFRYAYEPFIFAKTKGEDKRTTYAMAMKYFVIVDLLIFLGVMFYLDIIRYFIDPRYFVGLRVVPIIMLAELFSGIFSIFRCGTNSRTVLSGGYIFL